MSRLSGMSLMLLGVRGHNAWPEPPAPLLFPTQCQLGRNSSCCQKPFWWRQPVAVPATISKLPLPRCAAVSDGWLVNEWTHGRNFGLGPWPLAPPLTVPLLPSTLDAVLWRLRELSRACAALTEPAPLPPSQATFEQLSAHHPQSAMPDISRLGPARPAAVPELSSEAVIGALKTFPRASATGPSGLRADHIKETLATAHGDEVTAHLVGPCQLLAKGEAPAVVAPYLGGARLHALPKKTGGVRPIAVGETIRRLVGKVLCHATRDDSNQYFWPLQVGVGVKLGSEAAVHTARQWVERNAGTADKVLLKVDFQNAFNSVDRFALLSETRAAFPGLACFLRFGKHTIPSTRGIQQGDPLGPLLFSAALQPALRKTAQCPVELCFSYLDDAVLAGRADAVAAGLDPSHHLRRYPSREA